MSNEAGGFWDDAEVISVYSREQALEEGTLGDVTKWGADGPEGFHGGFHCPVVMTRALWSVVEYTGDDPGQDTRGRAHDVLWMACVALRRAFAVNKNDGGPHAFAVLLSHGRKRKATLWVVAAGAGAAIGFPEDF